MKTLFVLKKIVGVNPNWLAGLVLPWLLAACSAPAVRPLQVQSQRIGSVLIVPVAAAPLEVIPDLLEQRDAAYRHAQNMAMGVTLETQRYRTAGGIIVAGRVDNEDDTQAKLDALPPTAAGPAASESVWTPALMAGDRLADLLVASNRNAVLSREEYRLPIADDASLQQWHRAVQSWYALDSAATDHADRGRYDAVLELAVGRYRIFEGQTSLQLMLKLIDPASGRVLARTHAESFRVDDGALASLEYDGKAFRELIADMAVPLLRQTLGDLGLRSLPSADQS